MPRSYLQNRPTVPLDIDFLQEEAQAVRQCASEDGLTLDELIRAATQDYIRDHNGLPVDGRPQSVVSPDAIKGFPFFQNLQDKAAS